MRLTDAMMLAAIEKAVEVGLLPKYVRKDESASEREILRLVLQAALQVRPARGLATDLGARGNGLQAISSASLLTISVVKAVENPRQR